MLDPRGKAFAEIVRRHHCGELLALDLQPFADAHVQSAGHGGDDAADRKGRMTNRASSRAADNSSSCGTIMFTNPISSARAGANGSPVSKSSSARFRPASRGSRWVPPKVGGMPRLISGLANSAPRRWRWPDERPQ